MTKYRINGFKLLHAFDDWVLNNQDKVRSVHVALYLSLVLQNNKLNWVEWFRSPFDRIMRSAAIGNNNTYYHALKEMQSWGLIDYKPGVNNNKAPLIRLRLLYESEQVSVQP